MVERIRRTTQMSAQNLKLSNADVLQIADESIQTRLWPALRAACEDYAVTHIRMTFPEVTTDAPNSAFQRLPRRASGSTIVAVYVEDAANGVYPLSRLDISEAQRWANYGTNPPRSNRPGYYALTGDFIRILPAPSAAVNLRVLYERRPSRLVFPEDAGLVVSTDSVASQIVVDAVPAAFDAPSLLDLVRASQQATDPICDDVSLDLITPPDTLDVSFTDCIITSDEAFAQLSAGDYVCQAGETCVFPLPDLWFSVCIQQAAADCLDQAGYAERAASFAAVAEAKVQLAVQHSSKRVRKHPKEIFDRSSPLRRAPWGTYGAWGGWGGGSS